MALQQWPKFIIVGAARAGTTSLYYYLQQHQQIFLSKPKEPCFFAFPGHDGRFGHESHQIVTDPHSYQALFAKALPGQIRGEATALYLYHHVDVIQNIYRYHPEPRSCKIIIILRNPIDRAFSQYMMLVRDGREHLDFENAVQAEEERMHLAYHSDFFYVDRGRYFNQVKDYLEHFDKVQTLYFDDLVSRPLCTVEKVMIFLEIDSSQGIMPSGRYNLSGRPLIPGLNRLVQSRNPFKRFLASLVPKGTRERIKSTIYSINSRKDSISPGMRRYLADSYRDDVRLLGQMLDRDLSGWLTGARR